jgi:hypothetical protein
MTGAQFEIRIDGTPRSYRDRKDYAMGAARPIKSKNRHGWPHLSNPAALFVPRLDSHLQNAESRN